MYLEGWYVTMTSYSRDGIGPQAITWSLHLIPAIACSKMPPLLSQWRNLFVRLFTLIIERSHWSVISLPWLLTEQTYYCNSTEKVVVNNSQLNDHGYGIFACLFCCDMDRAWIAGHLTFYSLCIITTSLLWWLCMHVMYRLNSCCRYLDTVELQILS